MKILYIEDELSKNIPRIVRLFSKYLNTEQIGALEALEADESGYGGGAEEIKKIVEKTNSIEVEYSFPEALKKIIQHAGAYALFLVDRNLSKNEYTYKEVQSVDPKYTEVLYKRYSQTGREGDYLLQKLALFSPVDVTTQFYFLTAYPAHIELESANDIKQLIDLGKFKKENFFEKGKNSNFEKLRQIIETTKGLNLKTEHQIIQCYQKTLAYYSSQDSEASLWMARKTAEAMCRQIFEQTKPSSIDTMAPIALDKYIELLSKHKIVPQHIIIPLRVIQNYGNYGAHYQGEHVDAITNEYVQPCIQALTTIIKWYMPEHHQVQETELLILK